MTVSPTWSLYFIPPFTIEDPDLLFEKYGIWNKVRLLASAFGLREGLEVGPGDQALPEPRARKGKTK